MGSYYFSLAVRSLGRNTVLTALVIAVISVGIGASMTTLTVFRTLAGDPIPGKSGQLFAPQIDNWGPGGADQTSSDQLEDQLSYVDALALMNARAAERQAAMYATSLPLVPPNVQQQPFEVLVRATYSDFFAMFEVPFLYGAPWTAADDAARPTFAVLTRDLNNQLFGGTNSVGRTLTLGGEIYRIVGVLDDWQPVPHFFDLHTKRYGGSEDIFLPFTRAVERQMASVGDTRCRDTSPLTWDDVLRSECVWIQFWVELPTRADADQYRQFLGNYASEQLRSGRFHWSARVQLRDVKQWLSYQRVVSDEVRILVLVSFAFLLVCLLNAMALMLAKVMRRAGDIGVRRAVGASRRAVFAQCLIEFVVLGLLGGVAGLVLTIAGLAGLRALLSQEMAVLTHLDLVDAVLAMVLAVVATVIAGLYPTYRATQVQPAWQLKTL